MSKFFFHYNKPQSKLKGKPQISVHFKGKCTIVDNVVCTGETRGKINKRQPYFVMTGDAEFLILNNNVATLTGKVLKW